jgi:hypothetical protein
MRPIGVLLYLAVLVGILMVVHATAEADATIQVEVVSNGD